MGGSAPRYEAPDPGEDARSYLEAMSDPALQERVFQSRSQYDPLYAEMEFNNIRNMLTGTGGQGGLFDLLDQASQRSFSLQQQQLGQQRESDVAALNQYAPQVVEGYRKADPYSAGTADRQRAMSDSLYASAQGLTPQEERLALQQARAGSVSRGMGTSQSSLLAEALGRDEFKAGKQQRAMQAGQVAFGMDRTIAGDLGSVILGRPSSAMGLGQQMLGQATGMAPQMGSGSVFDIGTGVNYGLGINANQNNYNASVYGAQSQQAAGMMGAVGSLGGAAIGAMAI